MVLFVIVKSYRKDSNSRNDFNSLSVSWLLDRPQLKESTDVGSHKNIIRFASIYASVDYIETTALFFDSNS